MPLMPGWRAGMLLRTESPASDSMRMTSAPRSPRMRVRERPHQHRGEVDHADAVKGAGREIHAGDDRARQERPCQRL